MNKTKKAFFFVFLKLFIASLISTVAFYVVGNLIAIILPEETYDRISKTMLIVLSIILIVLFAVIFFIIAKIKGSLLKVELLNDIKYNRYSSGIKDLKTVIFEERFLILMVFIITVICFGLRSLDLLIFEKLTFSLITVPFTPLFSLSELFPRALHFIAFLIGFLSFVVIFISLTVIDRLIQSKKIYKQIEEVNKAKKERTTKPKQKKYNKSN